MAQPDDEEKLLRSVALQNAKSINLARQRAEKELAGAKEALEQKTAELARTLAMMRATLESTTDGILVTDGAGKVTHFNENFAQMWGLSRPIMASRDHQKILKTTSKCFDRPRQFLARIDGIYAASPPESHDLLELADGRVFERTTRIQFVEEQNVGRVWIFRDITERKRAEVALERLAADLSEADRRKNEFLAMLAHELRNPLAPILNSVQVLRLTGGNGEAVPAACEMMERQLRQMVRLVDDLLDVSRISRGRIELRRERIELAAVIRHAVEAARPMYANMNHELTVSLPQQPIFLNADPTRLAQVVGNLLNNASKFTDRGGRIALTVDAEGRGLQARVVIRVRDSGIGIAADQISRIFVMFTQLETSLERSRSGLGIGLALVKNLVELHGGTIEVHSAGIGQGSEFVVRLPMLLDALNAPTEVAVSEPATITACRILVVDDNHDSAQSLAMYLELTGNKTCIAHDGVAAVEAATSFLPDVVMLDIGLPRLNGYQVARKLREQPTGKSMVLVALTGWGQEADQAKSREAGFNAHLVKPVDLAVLTRLLAEMEASAPSGASAP